MSWPTKKEIKYKFKLKTGKGCRERETEIYRERDRETESERDRDRDKVSFYGGFLWFNFSTGKLWSTPLLDFFFTAK